LGNREENVCSGSSESQTPYNRVILWLYIDKLGKDLVGYLGLFSAWHGFLYGNAS
jgi:hypothetical protein